MYAQVYKQISEAVSIGNVKPPQDPNIFRGKKIPRWKTRVKYLIHSMQTSKRYEFMSTNDAIDADTTIQSPSQAGGGQQMKLPNWLINGHYMEPSSLERLQKHSDMAQTAKEIS